MNKIYIGIIMAISGLSWWFFTECLRHRPHNLKRSTQYLVWLGMPGVLTFISGVILILMALAKLFII